MPDEAKKSKIFYGWFIVAACFMVTVVAGALNWSLGVFFKPLESEFGWSRALISSGYTIYLIGTATSVLISGRLVDRFNPRPILLAAAVLLGLGISLCSQVQSINQLRFFLLIAGLGVGALWSVPNTVTMRWFHNRPKAGLALAIIISGIGAGALCFAPVINHLILTYHFRNAFLITGALFFILTALASIIIKPRPADIRDAGTTIGHEEIPIPQIAPPSWTLGKALATTAFAGIIFVTSMHDIAFQILAVHLVPLATDAGISATAAASAVGLMGGFSIPGRLVAGFLSARIHWQKILFLSFFAGVVSLLLLLLLKNALMLYLFVFCYGFLHGTRVTAHIGILGDFFGMQSLGRIIGISFFTAILLGSLGPYLAGFIFDTTGSYLGALIIQMIILSAAGLTALIIKKPSLKTE